MASVQATSEDLFRQYYPPLKSYLYRMTASEEDAEDLAAETFVRVLKHLESFEGKSSIKTWIFSIATNLARDHFRAQKRWSVDAQDRAKHAASVHAILADLRQLQDLNPAVQFEMRDHIDFCFTCMMKTLPLEQQIVLMLSSLYGFRTKEITTIVGKSEASVKHLLHQARHTLKDIFTQRCALVNQQGVCYQCTELNGIFNSKQHNQEEVMKLALVQAAKEDPTDQFRLLDVRLALIRGIDPCGGNRAALHLSHMQMLRAAIQDER
jgi:RNA polymerase sigma-70 factor, ECF subfamily